MSQKLHHHGCILETFQNIFRMIIPQTSSGQLLLQLSAVNFFPFDDNLPVKGTFLRFSTHLSLSKSWCGATYYVGVISRPINTP